MRVLCEACDVVCLWRRHRRRKGTTTPEEGDADKVAEDCTGCGQAHNRREAEKNTRLTKTELAAHGKGRRGAEERRRGRKERSRR